MKNTRKDYSGPIGFVLFFLIIIGFLVFQTMSWEPDKVVNKRYAGTVSGINTTNNVLINPSTDRGLYTVVLDSGQTYVLAKNVKAWYIKTGDKAWTVTAVLNGGKSKLIHYYLGVGESGNLQYYLLAE